MPCTPTAGLSHSYISQWATVTMLQQSSSLDAVPSLDPIPSPARGRVRVRKSRDDQSSVDAADEERHTPRGWENPGSSSRRPTHSPHPRPAQLAHVPSRGSMANLTAIGRSRARLQVRHPAVPPAPNPAMNFRRLAQPPQKPVDAKDAVAMNRTPSDVTNRFVQRERAVTTPSPDLIFNMSPVLGYEGPSRPYRVASRLSGEPDIAGDGEFDVPVDRVEELHIASESKASRDPSFLYAYAHAPSLPHPEPTPPLRSSLPPPYETSTGFTTSRETSDFEYESSLASTSGLVSQEVLEELDTGLDHNPCLIEPPAMPRLGRMHAKSDPLPTRLSSTSSGSVFGIVRGHSARTQPIPIPKPSPRVPSDYGGVNSSLAPSAPAMSVLGQWAKAPMTSARLAERKLRQEDENTPAGDVTGEWCGTAEVAPAIPIPTTGVPGSRRRRDAPVRKKRFFIGVGESYDGDMDSELSSWHAR